VVKLDEPVCNGQAYLEWLQKVNLFTIPLDEQKYWFRYHHLFKELLERELKKTFDKETIYDLNKRAGQWLGKNGFAKESITHFLKAKDIGSAIKVFKANRQELMNRVEWKELEQLLKLFPDDKIKKDAELLLLKSWVLIYQGKAFEAFELLPSIDLLLEKESAHESNAKNLYGELQVIKAWESYNIQHDFNATFHQSKSALKNLHSNNFYPRGMALIFWFGALQALGKYNDAITGIYEKIGETSNNILKSSLLLSLNYIYWLEADLSNLKRIAEQMGKIGRTQKNLEAETNSQLFSGIAYFLKTDFIPSVFTILIFPAPLH
jgi:LuxR family maltose regulon positive regulatory protein